MKERANSEEQSNFRVAVFEGGLNVVMIWAGFLALSLFNIRNGSKKKDGWKAKGGGVQHGGSQNNTPCQNCFFLRNSSRKFRIK